MSAGRNSDRARLAGAAAAALALCLSMTAAALAGGPAGSLTRVAGKDGCYTATGSDGTHLNGCRNIRGGGGATSLAVSPDGRFAYLVGYGTNGVSPEADVPVLSVFRRNARDGLLRQLPGKRGCFSINGWSEDGPGTCTNARDLDSGDATSLTISRDGRSLYVASQYRENSDSIGGVAIFRRDPSDGTLRQPKGKRGCVSATGGSEDGPGTCARGREMDDSSAVHLTPDQRFLYVSNYDNSPNGGIAVFARSRRTGALRQLKGKDGCITGDGTTLQSSPSRVCRVAENLAEVWDVATPDNHFAYVPASYGPDLLQVFRRNSKGGLVQMAGKHSCISDDGTSPSGACVDGRGMFRLERAVVSPNKRFIYTAGYVDNGVFAVVDRNPATGLISQRAGIASCMSSDGASEDGPGTCRNGRALAGGYAGAIAPSGRTLYFPSYKVNAVDVFRVSPRTGAFGQLPGRAGCVSLDGSSEDGAGTCGKAPAHGPYQVALAGRGRDVYLSSDTGGVTLLQAAR
ncbi:MAG: hypothetical protein U0R52_07470 [Solirubrobacterales bacterium]